MERNTQRVKSYLRFIYAVPLSIAFIVMIVGFITANKIGSFLEVAPTAILFLSIAIPLRVFNEISSTVLQAVQRPFASSLGFNVIEKAVLIIATYIVAVNRYDLTGVIIGMTIAIATSALYHTISNRSFILRAMTGIQGPKADMQTWISFSTPLLIAGVFTYVLNWTGNLFIAAFLERSDLGIYGIAFSFSNYLIMIPATMVSLFVPVASRMLDKRKKLAQVFTRIRTWSFIIVTFLSSVLIFFPEEILVTLYGAPYAAGKLSLQILALGFLLSTYVSYGNTILYLEKKTQTILYVTAGSALLNVALTMLLINIWPTITAVAISSATSFFIARLVEYCISRNYLVAEHETKKIALIVCSGFASAILAKQAYTAFAGIPLLAIGLAAVIYATIFVIALVKTRSVTHADKQIIIALVNGK